MLHERPGHLMLTSAFHDLTDLARLELQPLRSTLSSSEPEEAAPGRNSPGDAPEWRAGPPGTLEQSDSAVSSRDQEPGKGRYQQGKVHNGYNALHNGRNDSAADFGAAHAHGSSAPSSLAVSSCGSEESELLSIREHGPDQALHGHSLAEGVPDQERNKLHSSGSCAPGSSSIPMSNKPEQQYNYAEQDSAELRHGPRPARADNGSSGRAWLQEHDSARPPDAKHRSSSIAEAQSRQQEFQPYAQSSSRLPGTAQRQSLSESCRGAARWFRSVPWSQVGGPSDSCGASCLSACSMLSLPFSICLAAAAWQLLASFDILCVSADNQHANSCCICWLDVRVCSVPQGAAVWP